MGYEAQLPAMQARQAYDTQQRLSGTDAGRAHLAPQPSVAVDPAVLRLAAMLTHPDRHPEERQADATRVTAELLSVYSLARR
jgi:hypothetical protein